METRRITKDDIDAQGYYKHASLEAEGNIEVDANLGWVRFTKRVSASGYIWAKAGAGIEAGGGIEAGAGIEAGGGIKAGLAIICSAVLSARFSIYAGVVTWCNPTDEDRLIRASRVEGQVQLGRVELHAAAVCCESCGRPLCAAGEGE